MTRSEPCSTAQPCMAKSSSAAVRPVKKGISPSMSVAVLTFRSLPVAKSVLVPTFTGIIVCIGCVTASAVGSDTGGTSVVIGALSAITMASGVGSAVASGVGSASAASGVSSVSVTSAVSGAGVAASEAATASEAEG